MSTQILDIFNRIGSVSGKHKSTSGYVFDKYGGEIDGVSVTYHEGAREVSFESNEKIFREKRNDRRRKLYNDLREQDSFEFEAKKANRREKYKYQGRSHENK
jgi:hypothetical protein